MEKHTGNKERLMRIAIAGGIIVVIAAGILFLLMSVFAKKDSEAEETDAHQEIVVMEISKDGEKGGQDGAEAESSETEDEGT